MLAEADREWEEVRDGEDEDEDKDASAVLLRFRRELERERVEARLRRGVLVVPSGRGDMGPGGGDCARAT